MAQVSGRAGRGNRPGRVILQTYNPEHFSISSAGQQDFIAFYRQEIGYRKALNYPPFSRMILLKISGRGAQLTENHARQLGDLCRALKIRDTGYHQTVEIMGPIEASLTRIAGRFRWQGLLKCQVSTSVYQSAFIREPVRFRLPFGPGDHRCGSFFHDVKALVAGYLILIARCWILDA